MEQHTSQHWTYKQDTTTFPWMNPQYLKQQAPTYFQELMKGVLKDFFFAIAYLDDIIIVSRMAEEHLSHIKQVFEKLQNAHLLMKLNKCHLFTKESQYLRHILSTKGITPLPSKTQAIKTCTYQKQLHKYSHSLDLSDTIGNLSRTLPRWQSH